MSGGNMLRVISHYNLFRSRNHGMQHLDISSGTSAGALKKWQQKYCRQAMAHDFSGLSREGTCFWNGADFNLYAGNMYWFPLLLAALYESWSVHSRFCWLCIGQPLRHCALLFPNLDNNHLCTDWSDYN